MLKRQATTNPDHIFGKCPTSVDLAAVFHKEKPRKRRYSQVGWPADYAPAATAVRGGNGRWHVNPFLQRTSSGMWEEDRLLQEEEEEYLDVSIRSPARQAIMPLCSQKRHNDRECIYFVSGAWSHSHHRQWRFSVKRSNNCSGATRRPWRPVL
jgi:hypothetical protein